MCGSIRVYAPDSIYACSVWVASEIAGCKWSSEEFRASSVRSYSLAFNGVNLNVSQNSRES